MGPIGPYRLYCFPVVVPARRGRLVWGISKKGGDVCLPPLRVSPVLCRIQMYLLGTFAPLTYPRR